MLACRGEVVLLSSMCEDLESLQLGLLYKSVRQGRHACSRGYVCQHLRLCGLLCLVLAGLEASLWPL